MDKIRVVTHSGRFHADDAFAVATIFLLLKRRGIKVIRTRDEKIIKTADYAIDVGRAYDPKTNRFDHHQQGGAGERKNSIPYAAFGLVWKTFGRKLCNSERIAGAIDRKLVQPIDAGDNGVDIYSPLYPFLCPYTINDVIGNFSQTGLTLKNDKRLSESFLEAVAFAENIIKKEIHNERENEKMDRLIEKTYRSTKDKRIIIFNDMKVGKRAIDVLHKFKKPLFVILPDQKKTAWYVTAVRTNPPSYKIRALLPRTWAGKHGNELKDVTGVTDVIFCHNKRFVAGTKSKKGSLALSQLAIKNRNKK